MSVCVSKLVEQLATVDAHCGRCSSHVGSHLGVKRQPKGNPVLSDLYSVLNIGFF